MADEIVRLVLESTDSEHISLDDFVAQLDALRSSLQRTDESLNAGQQTVDWEVTGLSHSSPATVELRARPRRRPTLPKAMPEEVIEAFKATVEALGQNKAPRPELDYSGVNSYRALGAPVSAGRITAIVWTPSGSVTIKPEVEQTASRVLDEDVVTESSYKGLLEFMNIHGRKHEFRIYPPAGPNYVTCQFAREQLEEAKSAVGRAVRVHGKLVYKARSAFPYCIQVDRIEILPNDQDLPPLMSLRGIAPKATGDLSSEEFVRRLRNAS